MESDPRTIYVDMDDVLCQAARHFLVIVEREFGKRIAYEELTNFDVGRSCGLRLEECDELYRIVHRPDELLSMAPINDAIAVLGSWQQRGFEIAIITGRPPETSEASIEWLTKHRVPFRSFTVVDKYSRFATEQSGAISLSELAARRFCWAVEDSLPMAQYLANEMNLTVALIDRPWNQSAAEHKRISRYADWLGIAKVLPPKIAGNWRADRRF
jgi:uncharacterized HAD superfamily protein